VTVSDFTAFLGTTLTIMTVLAANFNSLTAYRTQHTCLKYNYFVTKVIKSQVLITLYVKVIKLQILITKSESTMHTLCACVCMVLSDFVINNCNLITETKVIILVI